MLLISTAPPEIVRFVMGYKKFAHHSHSEHFVWQLKRNRHVCREATLSIVFLHSLSIGVCNERKRFRVDPSLLFIYLFFVCLQVYKKAIKKLQMSSEPCKNSGKNFQAYPFPLKGFEASKARHSQYINTPMQFNTIFYGSLNNIFGWKFVSFFLFTVQTSSRFQRAPTIYILSQNEENKSYPCKPQFSIYTVGLSGCSLLWFVNIMVNEHSNRNEYVAFRAGPSQRRTSVIRTHFSPPDVQP